MTKEIGSIELRFNGPNNTSEYLTWYFKPNSPVMILQSRDVPLGASYPISELETALVFAAKGVARIAVLVSEGKLDPDTFDVDKFTREEWPIKEDEK